MLDYKRSIEHYYRNKFIKFGATPQGVDWNGPESQMKRFEVQYELVKSALSRNSKVIDFGCGYGAMATFLQTKSFDGQYTGLDVIEEFIQFAAAANSAFTNYRFVTKIPDNEKFDVLFASGIFHVVTDKRGSWILDYVKPTIEHMLNISDVCIMNFLRPNPTVLNDNLFFPKVNSILALISSTDFKFDIVEDYGLWEYTLMICRKSRSIL
jgi:SAM-dependent methyltransferase